jgi:hypothetical protein
VVDSPRSAVYGVFETKPLKPFLISTDQLLEGKEWPALLPPHESIICGLFAREWFNETSCR